MSDQHMISALEMYFASMRLIGPDEVIVGHSYSDFGGLSVIVQKEVSK